MKNKLAVVGIVFVLLISMAITFPTCTKVQTTSVPKIGVYYYPWYLGTKYGDIVDEPIIGWQNYWSNSTYVINKHLDWFKDLRIDFLIISWTCNMIGGDGHVPINYTNECTKLIFDAVKERNDTIQLAIMVEPFIVAVKVN